VWATAQGGGPSVFAESKGWTSGSSAICEARFILAAQSYLNSAIFFSESLVAPLKTA
jgi:hypothetical protein